METAGITPPGGPGYAPGGIKQPGQEQPETPQKASLEQNVQAGTAGATQEMEKKKLEMTGPPPHIEEKHVEDTESTPAKEEIENEEALIADMTKNIKETSYKVSKKINKSAYRYMKDNKKWIRPEVEEDAVKFFTIKIPKVMAQELSEALNDALGLTPEDDSEEA